MREKINFDKDWLFHLGDIEVEEAKNVGYVVLSAKTERAIMGPAAKNYIADTDFWGHDDVHVPETWEDVNLPHDYVVGGTPNSAYDSSRGFLKYENAWYIKKFTLGEEDKNKRITLLFEGVATHATVYLNGCLMKRNFCGYTSFEVDITDVVHFDGENRLAVYVDARSHEGWWYEGGGIYRHVYMIKTDLVSVDLWGVYVRPRKTGKGYSLDAKITVRNDGDQDKLLEIVCDILDAEGGIFTSCKGAVSLDKRSVGTVITNRVENLQPLLWSPENPYQYTARTRIYKGGNLVDEYSVRFGFRSFYVDPQKGLFINDKHYKIKGLCGHADFGLTGKAVPDNIHRYKVRLMKEMGANGYRTSHYPQAEALMDALDENGFIVMDEIRWFESTEEGKAQLEMLVKRDRNRPSVFFWSLGNEEPHHVTEQGRRIFKTLKAYCEKLDDSRMIMTAVSYSPDRATVYEDNDVIGINYNWQYYDDIHRKYPDKGVFASECCATGTTRGWYFADNTSKAFLPAYDHDMNDYFRGREFTWKYLASRDWILGGYQWIAFEHRGEAKWPRLCSQSGAVDLFMQKKDAFYQNQSYWRDAPMIHLLPHWNFVGLEGQNIAVWAYTNVEVAELFLNGKSLGKRQVERYGHAEWSVPYCVGKLEVKGYIDGKLVAEDSVSTTGRGVKLKLVNETPEACANGEDMAIITCTVLDEFGREVPDATPYVQFSVEGDCSIHSTGSDVTDHTSLFLPERKMRAGKISVAVKLGEKAEGMKVYAFADGLASALLIL